MDKKTVIEKFRELYGDKYDYSKMGNISSTSDKITIICPIHGEFEKTINNHLHGQECKYCKTDERIKREKEKFIKKAIEIHGDKYDYSKVEYKDNKTDVCIICPIHGEFWQKPYVHVNQGCGCQKCANKNKTLEEILDKCKEIHGDKYDYSLIDSPNMSKTQKIKCNRCGRIFEIDLNAHIHAKRGCKYCNHRSYAYTTEEFIERAKKVHGDKYDYSKVEYVDKKTPIIIICPIHGEFEKSPEKHLRGQGCQMCSRVAKLTNEIFIKRSKKIHGNKYDYSKVECKGTDDKVCIICLEHGEFWQPPHSHMTGVGCPACHEENHINETKLFDFIKENYGDEVISQYKADWLGKQTIDIYIPSKKVGIEYQGVQHFKPVKYFGGKKKYEYTVTKDKEKFEKCKNNGIKLFYFSKEKELPNNYLDTIYNSNNDLLNEIENYGT